MTNTPTEEREGATNDDAATPVPAPPAAPAVTEAEPIPFWQRRYVEKFLVPLVLPLAVIVGLVAFILNVSRLFLSAHGHIPIFVGSFILGLILVGATLLSLSPEMRSGSVTLVGVGFILLIMSSGWLVLGSAEPEHTGPTTLPTNLKTDQEYSITAAPGGALKYAPENVKAKTGLVTFKILVAAPGHTFTLQDPTTLFPSLILNDTGKVDSAVAFFAKPGTYKFFCAIPGHEAGGMKGTIVVTGPEMTLEEALAESGNPPSAAE